MTSEKHVKQKVKKILDKHGWFWWMPPANGYGKAGISDILSIKRGTFMAIETKFGGNKATALQIGFLHSIEAEQGFGFLVNEKNLDWLEAFLAAFDRAADARGKRQPVTEADGAEMLNAIRELTRY